MSNDGTLCEKAQSVDNLSLSSNSIKEMFLKPAEIKPKKSL